MPRVLLLIALVAWPVTATTPGSPLSLACFAAGLLLPAGLAFVLPRRGVRVQGLLLLAALAWGIGGGVWLGWPGAVATVTPGGVGGWPGVGKLLGVLPVVAAWAAVWAVQHPALRSAAEHTTLGYFDHGLPVHPFPGRAAFVADELRQRVLILLAPVAVLLLARDAAALAAGRYLPAVDAEVVELVTVLGGVALMMLLGPVLLRRVLPTRPVPPGPLRDRLEAVAQRAGAGWRDVLIWDTHHRRPNALVMGIVRPGRYVLLSDLLIETLTDRQLDAVVGHELGHVRHRHLLWLVAAGAGLLLALAGPGEAAELWLAARVPAGAGREAAAWGVVGAMLLAAGLAFAWVSRRFERQADAFGAGVAGGPAAMAEALAVVGALGHVPAAAPGGLRRDVLDTVTNPLHGSLGQRIRRLGSPGNAAAVDRQVAAVKLLIAATLAVAGGYVTWRAAGL